MHVHACERIYTRDFCTCEMRVTRIYVELVAGLYCTSVSDANTATEGTEQGRSAYIIN